MRLLDLTLADFAANVALDEALLDAAAAAPRPEGVLRLWEATACGVVLGRGSLAAREVQWDACRAASVPVVRRPSGGAAIVAGPGCLMYAAILPRTAFPGPLSIDRVHEAVLDRVASAVARCGVRVRRSGTSDLTLVEGGAASPRKISGNSLRVKRDFLLYHGTLLYGFDLELIGRLLATPPRQPAYRGGRSHAEFLTNLPVAGTALRKALAAEWGADQPYEPGWCVTRAAELAGSEAYRVAEPPAGGEWEPPARPT
jgi:lipoate-protein ligase A